MSKSLACLEQEDPERGKVVMRGGRDGEKRAEKQAEVLALEINLPFLK